MIRSASTTSNGSPRADSSAHRNSAADSDRAVVSARSGSVRAASLRRCSSAAVSASCAHLASPCGGRTPPSARPLRTQMPIRPDGLLRVIGLAVRPGPIGVPPLEQAELSHHRHGVGRKTVQPRPRLRHRRLPSAPQQSVHGEHIPAPSDRHAARHHDVGCGAVPPHPSAAPTRPRSQQPPQPGPARSKQRRASPTAKPNSCSSPNATPTSSPGPTPLDRSQPRTSSVLTARSNVRGRVWHGLLVGHTGGVLFEQLALASPPSPPPPSAPRRSRPWPPSCVKRPRTRSEPRSRSPATPSKGRSISWATISDVRAEPASEATLTINDVHEAIDALAAMGGGGSVGSPPRTGARTAGQGDRARAAVIRAILGGELAKGALDGVMAAAVAKAADVSLAEVQRRRHVHRDSSRAGLGSRLLPRQPGLGGNRAQSTHPVQPMLASPAASIADALAETGLASVEWKLDRTDPGPPRGRRCSALHPQPERRHRSSGRSRRGRARLCPAAILSRRRGARSRRRGHPSRFQDTMGDFGADAAGIGAGRGRACRRSSSTPSTPAPASSTSR